MSNQWRDDTFSMVQLIQRGIVDGLRYVDIVLADEAQNHPIIEFNGELHWQQTERMAFLLNNDMFRYHHFSTTARDEKSPELKAIARDCGWSLSQYAEIFHTKLEAYTHE